ncbi:MAG TPA: glycosyltransferase family 2 protein [Longimicrobium sp.]|jgi:glycosyltransferase involved in cell wall biosynthesis
MHHRSTVVRTPPSSATPASESLPAAPPRQARVQILLSTYNGAEFLPELLESLDAQSLQDFHLRVRDDGSTDGTLAILDEYARRRPATVERGAHVGVPESFFRALRDAEPRADFFAYCDQDDVWLPGKVARAVECLSRADPARPALYCSGLTPVDVHLEPLDKPRRTVRALDFRNALVENQVSGCTMMFNHAAWELLTRSTPRGALMHDHWAYLVVSAFGTIHFDPEPSLLYRQHPRNTVGMPRGLLSRVRAFQKRRGMSPLFAQAEEFRALYGGTLDGVRLAALDRFLASRQTPARRLRYALRPATYRHRLVDDVAHRLMVALGYF